MGLWRGKGIGESVREGGAERDAVAAGGVGLRESVQSEWVGCNPLGCRFLDPELGAVAGGGEHPDEHIGRDAPGVAIGNGRDPRA